MDRCRRPRAFPRWCRQCAGGWPPVLVLGVDASLADVAALCERALALLERHAARVLVCDVAALEHPDLATLEALAKLQLAARRGGRELRLRHAPAGLRGLLALTGFTEVLPPEGRSGVETRR